MLHPGVVASRSNYLQNAQITFETLDLGSRAEVGDVVRTEKSPADDVARQQLARWGLEIEPRVVGLRIPERDYAAPSDLMGNSAIAIKMGGQVAIFFKDVVKLPQFAFEIPLERWVFDQHLEVGEPVRGIDLGGRNPTVEEIVYIPDFVTQPARLASGSPKLSILEDFKDLQRGPQREMRSWKHADQRIPARGRPVVIGFVRDKALVADYGNQGTIIDTVGPSRNQRGLIFTANSTFSYSPDGEVVQEATKTVRRQGVWSLSEGNARRNGQNVDLKFDVGKVVGFGPGGKGGHTSEVQGVATHLRLMSLNDAYELTGGRLLPDAHVLPQSLNHLVEQGRSSAPIIGPQFGGLGGR